MMTIDFSRSFLTFRIDTANKPPKTVSHQPPFSLNNARIQLECVCWVTEKASNQTQRFVLGASCKTERVGVEREIWTEPNADFAPIFSDDEFMHLKTYAQAGIEIELYPPGSGTQSDRQSGMIAEMFDSVRIDVTECEGEVLPTSDAIVGATLANQRLVARTKIQNDRYSATLEYPVKTMNANERDSVYQTDTGPVLVPDLAVGPEQMLEQMQLGFAAFNCPSWIELLVRMPTRVSDETSVYHYSHPVRFDSTNEILRID